MRIKITIEATHITHTAGRDRYYETLYWSKYTYKCTEVADTGILQNGWKYVLLAYKTTANENQQITEQQSDYFIDFSFSKNSQPELKEKIIKDFEIELNEKHKKTEINYYTCKQLLLRIAKEHINTDHYKESTMTNFFLFKTEKNLYDASKSAASKINVEIAKKIGQVCKPISEGVSLKLKLK